MGHGKMPTIKCGNCGLSGYFLIINGRPKCPNCGFERVNGFWIKSMPFGIIPKKRYTKGGYRSASR